MSVHVKTSQGPQKPLRPQRVIASLKIWLSVTINDCIVFSLFGVYIKPFFINFELMENMYFVNVCSVFFFSACFVSSVLVLSTCPGTTDAN